MTDFLPLIEKTPAYKIMKREKESNRLSHAYLIISHDGENLKEYLKIFGKLIACENGEACGICRPCRLIAEEKSVDTLFYPKEKDSVVTEDIVSLTEECYIKPVDSD